MSNNCGDICKGREIDMYSWCTAVGLLIVRQSISPIIFDQLGREVETEPHVDCSWPTKNPVSTEELGGFVKITPVMSES